MASEPRWFCRRQRKATRATVTPRDMHTTRTMKEVPPVTRTRGASQACKQKAVSPMVDPLHTPTDVAPADNKGGQ